MATTKTVRLRRLAAELRRLRAAAGVSREQVTERTGINNATLYRIETARARPQRRTLLALLDAYEVGQEQREDLITLSKDAAQPGWLRPHHDRLPEEYAAYISFEGDASRIRNYESLFIPGLLQTEDYARAVIRGGLPTATSREVEDRVRARIERQQVLSKPTPLILDTVIDEAALHRQVGGPDTLHAQLDHLLQAATVPHITLRVIPFTAGAHPGMPGAFALIDFPDPQDADLVYVDSIAGDLFLDTETDIHRYTTLFTTLHATALEPADTTALIAELAHHATLRT